MRCSGIDAVERLVQPRVGVHIVENDRTDLHVRPHGLRKHPHPVDRAAVGDRDPSGRANSQLVSLQHPLTQRLDVRLHHIAFAHALTSRPETAMGVRRFSVLGKQRL